MKKWYLINNSKVVRETFEVEETQHRCKGTEAETVRPGNVEGQQGSLYD